MQKTILLPIYNGIRSRNFFQTDVYPELVKDVDVRLVIIVPSRKIDFYRDKFKEENVIFDSWDDVSEPRLGRMLNFLAFNLLDTGTIRYKQELTYLKDHDFLKFAALRIFNKFFSGFDFPLKIIRFLDGFASLNLGAVALLDKYKPDMVIVPDIVFSPDRIFLRAAKRKGFFTVGTIRSWDNLTSKGVVQVLPDKLIVQTTKMKQEAIKFVRMPEKDIIVSGIPQFDDYFKKADISREDFLKQLGIPSGRRLILCAPFFDAYCNDSATKIINDLICAARSGRLSSDIHFLVRNRPESMGASDIEKNIIADNRVTITNPCEYVFDMGKNRYDHEFSREDVGLLTNSLRFSDVTINTISTLTIDAAAFDKPVINIRFDNKPDCPPEHSVKILSRYDHYKEIESTGGVRLAYSMDELIDLINQYLENPRLDSEGREKIRRQQIEFMDGNSGKRVADKIKELLISV